MCGVAEAFGGMVETMMDDATVGIREEGGKEDSPAIKQSIREDRQERQGEGQGKSERVQNLERERDRLKAKVSELQHELRRSEECQQRLKQHNVELQKRNAFKVKAPLSLFPFDSF